MKPGIKSTEAWGGAALLAAMYESMNELSWQRIAAYGIMAALVMTYTICRTFAKQPKE